MPNAPCRRFHSGSRCRRRPDDHESSIAANHALEHYVDGAAAADASTDPSIREQLASLRAAGFLGAGGTATSQVLQVTR